MIGLSNNVFTTIGLFVTSALSFAVVTAIFGGVVTDFDSTDWSIFAWFVGTIIYGITFAVMILQL